MNAKVEHLLPAPTTLAGRPSTRIFLPYLYAMDSATLLVVAFGSEDDLKVRRKTVSKGSLSPVEADPEFLKAVLDDFVSDATTPIFTPSHAIEALLELRFDVNFRRMGLADYARVLSAASALVNQAMEREHDMLVSQLEEIADPCDPPHADEVEPQTAAGIHDEIEPTATDDEDWFGDIFNDDTSVIINDDTSGTFASEDMVDHPTRMAAAEPEISQLPKSSPEAPAPGAHSDFDLEFEAFRAEVCALSGNESAGEAQDGIADILARAADSLPEDLPEAIAEPDGLAESATTVDGRNDLPPHGSDVPDVERHDEQPEDLPIWMRNPAPKGDDEGPSGSDQQVAVKNLQVRMRAMDDEIASLRKAVGEAGPRQWFLAGNRLSTVRPIELAAIGLAMILLALL